MINKFTTEKLRVEIDKIAPNKWNPNKQDDFIYQKEKDSIERFGFLDPILVRKIEGGYEIIDGEHRWKACKDLGYTEIVIENYGSLTNGEAKALTIALNNIKGQDDPILRGLIFRDLKQSFPDLLKLLPFDENTILNDIELVDFKMDYPEGQEFKDKMYEIFKFNIAVEDAPMVVRVLESFNKDYDVAFMELIHKTDKGG